MLKKIIILSICFLITSLFSINVYSESVDIEPKREKEIAYNTTSNYYGKVDDKTKITNPDSKVLLGYKKVACQNGNTLYVDEAKLNIAVKLASGYIFYSVPDYYGFNIKAYLVTGGLSEISSTLQVDGKYKSSMMEKSASPKLLYEEIENGFKVTINFIELGISINVYVSLNDKGEVVVKVPSNEIKEEGYLKETTTLLKDENGQYIKGEDGKFVKETVTTFYQYYLSAFELFEYFGAVGETQTFSNKINGYTLIPDGSGALVRYQYDTSYSTRYSKRIYGNDYGIKEDAASTAHLSDQATIDVPVYGVNHGYNQYAFINTITEGAGEAELYFEPYGYSSRKLETTYYRFYLRETYNVKMSTQNSGSTVTLPTEKYHTDYSFTYSFLFSNNANYSGMAKYYRDNYLNLEKIEESENISLGLNVLAQDYKKGLFSKKFISMTQYSELVDILSSLRNEGVNKFSVSYKGLNKNGYYNNNSYKPKISSNLGGKKDYYSLIDYIKENGDNLEYCTDILTSYQETKKGVTKKYNLDVFSKSSESNLFDETYLYDVKDSSLKITKYNKNYEKMNISSINLESFSRNNYSYRYKGINYSRDESIKMAVDEIKKINENYSISLVKAHSYMYDYVDRIYENETSSSLYTYMSDSVPFISLILSGYVELYSKEINFISDYNQYVLRLIEYNIYPYFVITNNESSLLRYTNSEDLYTSEFTLWKDIIIKFYSASNEALKNVVSEEMVSHEYIANGISLTTYSNGVKIYVNHTNKDYNDGFLKINKLSFEVKR